MSSDETSPFVSVPSLPLSRVGSPRVGSPRARSPRSEGTPRSRSPRVFSPTVRSPIALPASASSQPSHSGNSLRDIELEEPILQPSPSRYLYLDAFRGAIMAVMAWDHSLDYLGNALNTRGPGTEMWSGPLQTYNDSLGTFVSRAASHICAPGFFFTMGISMHMFTQSRLNRGWARSKIAKFYLMRGTALIALGRLVNILEIFPWIADYARGEAPASHLKPTWLVPFLGVFQVLFALGISMMLFGVCVPFLVPVHGDVRRKWGKVISAACGVVIWATSAIVIVTIQDGNPAGEFPWPRASAQANTFWRVLVRFFLLPGRDTVGFIMYSTIPWVGQVAMGFSLVSHTNSATVGQSAGVGCALLILFILIRFVGPPLLNFRGYPRGEFDGPLSSFFTVCKYPPDAAFLTLTMGVNMLIMSCCKVEPTRYTAIKIRTAMLTLGNVALFFYVVHQAYLSLLSFFLHLAGITLPVWLILVHWPMMLFALLQPCRRYGKFKQSTLPESLWRLL